MTHDWELYQKGIDYNNSLDPDYYKMLDENDRMEAGDQWHGVKANGLPTPVFNVIKPAGNYLVSAICGENFSMNVVSEKLNVDKTGYDEKAQKYAKLLTAYLRQLSERNKLEDKIYQVVSEAYKTGDMALYSWFDVDYGTGEMVNDVEIMGDITLDTVDGCNIFLGNPSDPEINCNGRPKQPWIIIAFRKMTEDVKEEAKNNGVYNWDEIESDENDNQVGDNADYDLNDKSSGKTTVLLKLWREDGVIKARKSTKNAMVRDEWETGYSIYPVVFGNYEPRKNTYHGQSPVTHMVHNQRYINKMFAVVMLIQLMHANPKILIDTTKVQSISNKIGGIIEVNGETDGAARYLEPKGLTLTNITAVIEQVRQLTMDMVGANDTLLGKTNPEQASGRSIIAVQQQSQVPIEVPKQGLRQFYEDLGNVWIDQIATHYGVRTFVYEDEDGVEVAETIDFSLIKDMKMSIRIDVGPSSIYSEDVLVANLDNLLQNQYIDFIEYLERMPEGRIPLVDKLIEKRQEPEGVDVEALGQKLQSLPPEQQQQLMAMNPEERLMALQQM